MPLVKVKKTLQIDSADRDTTKYPTNGDYVVYLPRVYKNVTSLRLKGAEFQPLVSTSASTLATGLVLWLDATDPFNNGTQPPNGTIITTWIDKSGQGNNGTSAGINPVKYNVNNDTGNSMNMVQGTYFNTPYTSAPTSETIFIVFRKTIVNIFNQGLVTSTNTPGSRGLLIDTSNNIITTKQNVINFSASVPVSINTMQLAESVYNGTSSSLNGNTAYSLTEYVNSTNASTDSTNISANLFSGGGTTIISNPILEGGFIGTINEVLIYNNPLSTANRQKIEAYLSKKWNIPLPDGHPVFTYNSALTHLYANGQNNPSIDRTIDNTVPSNKYYFLMELEGLNKCDETRIDGDKSAFVDKYFAKIPATISSNGICEYNDKNLQENIATYSPAIEKLDRLHIKTRTHDQQDGSGFVYWPADYNLTFEIEYMDNQLDAKIE